MQPYKLSEQLIHAARLTCSSTLWSNISRELSFQFVLELHKLGKALKIYGIRIKLSKIKVLVGLCGLADFNAG